MLKKTLFGTFCLLYGMTQTVSAQDDNRTVDVIKPVKKASTVKSAAIDTEKFELGLYSGLISVEDFSSSTSLGLSFSYHISPKFMAQINYASTDVDRATTEEVSDLNLLSDDDRNFAYYNALAGYRLFQGRSFFGSKRKYNSDIYILGGMNNVDFAGESNAGLSFGASYRVVLSDWLTFNFDMRDHMVERNFLNDSKTTHNTEMSLGINALF